MSFLSAPTCRCCLQRLTRSALQQQVRTRTKLAPKVTTVSIRLMQDIPGIGQKGTISAVARGRMRNDLYPARRAIYVTSAELKRLSPEELLPTAAATDEILFGSEVAEPKVQLNLLKPAQTVSLLDSFLPPTLQFSRATISPTEKAIHGSISTADICAAVRAIAVASGEQGSRVVVTPDMISFLGEEAEGDKIKVLGEHKFEIRFKGNIKPILRTAVIAQQISLE